MQTLTRVEPCGCAYGRDCTRTTYCKAGAAVEAEANRRDAERMREAVRLCADAVRLHDEGKPIPWRFLRETITAAMKEPSRE